MTELIQQKSLHQITCQDCNKIQEAPHLQPTKTQSTHAVTPVTNAGQNSLTITFSYGEINLFFSYQLKSSTQNAQSPLAYIMN
jgi:hypothetical protein